MGEFLKNVNQKNAELDVLIAKSEEMIFAALACGLFDQAALFQELLAEFKKQKESNIKVAALLTQLIGKTSALAEELNIPYEPFADPDK